MTDVQSEQDYYDRLVGKISYPSRVLYGVSGLIVACSCPTFKRNEACDHVATWVAHGFDGRIQNDPYWPLLGSGVNGNRVHVVCIRDSVRSVPVNRLIIPTFVDRLDGSDLYKVVVAAGPGVIDEPVGFICKGEGRRSLRSLALEWLATQWDWEGDNTRLRCTSDFHTPGIAAIDNPTAHRTEGGLPDKDLLVDMWDVLATTRCRPCNLDDGVPDVL